MDTTTRVVSVLIILITLSLLTVTGLVVTRERGRRRRPLFALRPIPAYNAMPLLAGQAIESNRPVHMAFGSAGIGGANTVLALASAELFYQVAERNAIGDVPPIITMSDASALPLGQDALRRAYKARERTDKLRYSSVRWYPQGRRSLAYAAALTVMMSDDNVSSNILTGSFGPELALIIDGAARRKLPVIAMSDQLEGQAVAFALADNPLIGEEIFVAGAYLEDNTGQAATVLTMDILRWLLVLALLAGTVLTLRGA